MLMMHFGAGGVVDLRGLRSARRVMARQAKIVPCRFVRRIWAICSSFASGRRADCEIPAAFTRMSTLSYGASRLVLLCGAMTRFAGK